MSSFSYTLLSVLILSLIVFIALLKKHYSLKNNKPDFDLVIPTLGCTGSGKTVFLATLIKNIIEGRALPQGTSGVFIDSEKERELKKLSDTSETILGKEVESIFLSEEMQNQLRQNDLTIVKKAIQHLTDKAYITAQGTNYWLVHDTFGEYKLELNANKLALYPIYFRPNQRITEEAIATEISRFYNDQSQGNAAPEDLYITFASANNNRFKARFVDIIGGDFQVLRGLKKLVAESSGLLLILDTIKYRDKNGEMLAGDQYINNYVRVLSQRLVRQKACKFPVWVVFSKGDMFNDNAQQEILQQLQENFTNESQFNLVPQLAQICQMENVYAKVDLVSANSKSTHLYSSISQTFRDIFSQMKKNYFEKEKVRCRKIRKYRNLAIFSLLCILFLGRETTISKCLDEIRGITITSQYLKQEYQSVVKLHSYYLNVTNYIHKNFIEQQVNTLNEKFHKTIIDQINNELINDESNKIDSKSYQLVMDLHTYLEELLIIKEKSNKQLTPLKISLSEKTFVESTGQVIDLIKKWENAHSVFDRVTLLEKEKLKDLNNKSDTTNTTLTPYQRLFKVLCKWVAYQGVSSLGEILENTITVQSLRTFLNELQNWCNTYRTFAGVISSDPKLEDKWAKRISEIKSTINSTTEYAKKAEYLMWLCNLPKYPVIPILLDNLCQKKLLELLEISDLFLLTDADKESKRKLEKPCISRYPQPKVYHRILVAYLKEYLTTRNKQESDVYYSQIKIFADKYREKFKISSGLVTQISALQGSLEKLHQVEKIRMVFAFAHPSPRVYKNLFFKHKNDIYKNIAVSFEWTKFTSLKLDFKDSYGWPDTDLDDIAFSGYFPSLNARKVFHREQKYTLSGEVIILKFAFTEFTSKDEHGEDVHQQIKKKDIEDVLKFLQSKPKDKIVKGNPFHRHADQSIYRSLELLIPQKRYAKFDEKNKALGQEIYTYLCDFNNQDNVNQCFDTYISFLNEENKAERNVVVTNLIEALTRKLKTRKTSFKKFSAKKTFPGQISLMAKSSSYPNSYCQIYEDKTVIGDYLYSAGTQEINWKKTSSYTLDFYNDDYGSDTPLGKVKIKNFWSGDMPVLIHNGDVEVTITFATPIPEFIQTAWEANHHE